MLEDTAIETELRSMAGQQQAYVTSMQMQHSQRGARGELKCADMIVRQQLRLPPCDCVLLPLVQNTRPVF